MVDKLAKEGCKLPPHPPLPIWNYTRSKKSQHLVEWRMPPTPHCSFVNPTPLPHADTQRDNHSRAANLVSSHFTLSTNSKAVTGLKFRTHFSPLGLCL
ncbi:hypothetical protein TNCV_572461 [Trichonephila clavipes]|nr:hypothetical protein TNCV_572461 [Trichonephila clavipes]